MEFCTVFIISWHYLSIGHTARWTTAALPMPVHSSLTVGGAPSALNLPFVPGPHLSSPQSYVAYSDLHYIESPLNILYLPIDKTLKLNTDKT